MNMMVGTAAMVSGSSLAAASIDPILAAIEAHKKAFADFGLALDEHYRLETELPKDRQQSRIDAWEERIIETDDPRWIASVRRVKEADNEETDAALRLVDVTPTTLAGVLALLQHAVSHVEAKREWPTGLVDEGAPETALGRDWSFYLNKNIAEAIANIAA